VDTKNTDTFTAHSANSWFNYSLYYTNDEGKEICLRLQNCWILIYKGQNPHTAVTEKVEKFGKFIVDLKKAYDSNLEAGIDEKDCNWTVTNRTNFIVVPGCVLAQMNLHKSLYHSSVTLCLCREPRCLHSVLCEKDMLEFLQDEKHGQDAKAAVGIDETAWTAITAETEPSGETLKKIMEIGNTLYGVPTNVHQRYKAWKATPATADLAIPKI
jgi:hypothetical protein